MQVVNECEQFVLCDHVLESIDLDVVEAHIRDMASVVPTPHRPAAGTMGFDLIPPAPVATSLFELQTLGAKRYLRLYRLLHIASPANPEPRRSSVLGSGTDEGGVMVRHAEARAAHAPDESNDAFRP